MYNIRHDPDVHGASVIALLEETLEQLVRQLEVHYKMVDGLDSLIKYDIKHKYLDKAAVSERHRATVRNTISFYRNEVIGASRLLNKETLNKLSRGQLKRKRNEDNSYHKSGLYLCKYCHFKSTRKDNFKTHFLELLDEKWSHNSICG